MNEATVYIDDFKNRILNIQNRLLLISSDGSGYIKSLESNFLHEIMLELNSDLSPVNIFEIIKYLDCIKDMIDENKIKDVRMKLHNITKSDYFLRLESITMIDHIKKIEYQNKVLNRDQSCLVNTVNMLKSFVLAECLLSEIEPIAISGLKSMYPELLSDFTEREKDISPTARFATKILIKLNPNLTMGELAGLSIKSLRSVEGIGSVRCEGIQEMLASNLKHSISNSSFKVMEKLKTELPILDEDIHRAANEKTYLDYSDQSNADSVSKSLCFGLLYRASKGGESDILKDVTMTSIKIIRKSSKDYNVPLYSDYVGRPRDDTTLDDLLNDFDIEKRDVLTDPDDMREHGSVSRSMSSILGMLEESMKNV